MKDEHKNVNQELVLSKNMPPTFSAILQADKIRQRAFGLISLTGLRIIVELVLCSKRGDLGKLMGIGGVKLENL